MQQRVTQMELVASGRIAPRDEFPVGLVVPFSPLPAIHDGERYDPGGIDHVAVVPAVEQNIVGSVEGDVVLANLGKRNFWRKKRREYPRSFEETSLLLCQGQFNAFLELVTDDAERKAVPHAPFDEKNSLRLQRQLVR